MNADPAWVYALAAIVAAGLFAYLLYTLFDAEHLE